MLTWLYEGFDNDTETCREYQDAACDFQMTVIAQTSRCVYPMTIYVPLINLTSSKLSSCYYTDLLLYRPLALWSLYCAIVLLLLHCSITLSFLFPHCSIISITITFVNTIILVHPSHDPSQSFFRTSSTCAWPQLGASPSAFLFTVVILITDKSASAKRAIVLMDHVLSVCVATFCWIQVISAVPTHSRPLNHRS